MLKGQKLAACVKENYSRGIQIDHLNKQPTSIQTKLNPSFSTAIETQTTNPAKAYQFQMKRLLREDLSNDIRDRANSLKQKRLQTETQKKNGKEKTDGVLNELQKNGMKYSMVLQNRMNRQQERKRLFIDEDKLKNSKITQFVEKREDKDVFNHESDLYQQYQKIQFNHSLSMLEKQKEAKMQEVFRAQRERQQEEKKRLQFQRDLYYQNMRQKQEKRLRQQQYGLELTNMAQEKILKDSLDQKIAQTTAIKHNPITNPIEYHVENPYILKRMQERHHL